MTTLEFILALVLGVIASSGIWSIVLYRIQRRDKQKDNFTKLLLGLAHQEIIRTCFTYIHRGNVTKDEYEDLIKYLYNPYVELGGNDSTVITKLIDEVKKLPIKEHINDGE